MTTSRDDLAKVLVDVRKAYRLLHGYHRRLNDLLQRVEETVGQRGLVFERWAPANVDPVPGPKKAFFSPDKWAWDLTPAYQVTCAWSSSPTSGKVRRIGLVAVADTGYSVRGDGEPNPVRFTDAADCTTEIWIAAWTSDSKTPNWSKAWEAVQRIPRYDEGETHEIKLEGAKYSYRYLKTVNVADLINPDAVEQHLLAPIEEWLGTPGARQQVR
jgi:hypothetical protein